MDKTLHITNGDSFTERLKSMDFLGDILTWREMLCEGPVSNNIFSNEFIEERCEFLKRYSSSTSLQEDYEALAFSFKTLNFETYQSIVLWFEYDLFCHINLAAAVCFLNKNHPSIPLFLICSGHIENQEGLFALNELTNKQLLAEAEKRIHLTTQEIETLSMFWERYTSDEHTAMSTITVNNTKLPYLEDCINAHLQRFPEEETGINALESKVLRAIDKNEFISEKQLLGHLLKNQDYYGFGDLQWERIIKKMKPFYTEVLHLELNKKGLQLLHSKFNAFSVLKDTTQFGGILKYNYYYDSKLKQLYPAHEN
ncbi:DUF1835 domain-containing protein [Patiriisocius hiemis]|uniref:DUF1835 domain-containing protein n=1 Tax=Patiriisocius hiemis TaxID=3075604 RepID=A0ABU2YAD6_9FLAO|nr:DUF1835 domain-containing protein [Constantimarinum sp. W242]MDT0554816.1 DUF1835 domain-containing protein [Constantimarinum sp. W242]